ncbi:CxC2 domain-containing protein [Mycena chlorophos]|uniref:CxC2 domain-containing protein n=1 Tax=Mycena chlorophos TaxID=658473 RepID=A0A8H6TM83_MYCCL|nr:CxC2 domain-containing protein [Mycena chlorophos]
MRPLRPKNGAGARLLPPRVDASAIQLEEDFYELDVEADEGLGPIEPQVKVVKPSDPALAYWAESCRDNYLRALFWHDGRGYLSNDGCPLPFHTIRKWEHNFFTKTSLKSLGLRLQLGHDDLARACPCPKVACDEFVVIHTNGIHLLRSRLFPATVKRPQTSATFSCLERFQLASLQAGMTAQNFYAILEILTNAAGFKPPNRYRAFLRMSREYRALLMLKRAGVLGTAGNAVEDVKSGQLALRCPACPRPEVNLPPGWLDAPAEDQCLYTQFTATDACFALKRRLVSSELRDPALGSGSSYMVESAPYRAYLRTATNDQEMSTCSGLAALEQANTKFSKGYAATGVGMVVCARHEFVLPNAVGDLQKGERYSNIDYLFASALRHLHRLLRLMVSYDIVWSSLFADSFASWNKYNLNYVPGGGQTDAEGIERAWAGAARMAASTRQMGPGARSDLLDDYWSFWNWRKLIGLPSLLRRRLDNAEIERDRQLEAFESFSQQQAEHTEEWRNMVLEHEEDGSKNDPYAPEVKGMAEAEARLKVREEEEREAKRSRVSRRHEVGPVDFIEFGLSLEDLQRKIRTQAAVKKSQSTAEQINLGSLRKRFNVEQERFRSLQAAYTPDALVQLHALDLPQDVLAEKVPLLLPSALAAVWRRSVSDDDELEPMQQQLLAIEGKLRRGQCETSLVNLRNFLHLKYHLVFFKKKHVRHQAMNTRSRAIIAKNESHVLFHSGKYQTSWLALLQIENGDLEAVGFRRLRKKDIRCLKDAEVFSRREEKRRERAMQRKERLQQEGDLVESDAMDEDARTDEDEGGEDEQFEEGSNKKLVSWIWHGAQVGADAGMNEAVRIEWCNALALSRRWDEEVRMLGEELRRIPVFLQHKASWWLERARSVPLGSVSTPEAEGMLAYSLKSAALYQSLAASADRTRTQAKVARGRRTRRKVVVDDPLQPVEGDPEQEAETDTDDEELAERGDVDEDEWDV